MKNFIWINLVVFLTYTLLYFLLSDEYRGAFPVSWAVYFSVHGLGLWILSMVQRAIRNIKLSNDCLKVGSLILASGWIFTVIAFML